ncbi:MAG: hypothetical protein Q9168_002109 [Polycauliona sp. 1 TL-2023]
MVELATWRCDSVCMDPTPPLRDSTPSLLSSYITSPLKAELLNFTAGAPSLDTDPPPPYSDSLVDVPPSYQFAQELPDQQESTPKNPCQRQSKDYPSPSWRSDLQTFQPPLPPMTPVAVDLNDTSAFRQVAGKKKKNQAAKGSDWPDEPADGGAANGGAEGGDNAGGGAANNGDGGAGDDGGGGEDWNFGGGKKKKGKKGKNAVDEEEEKKKKEEEEEQKRKEEEEAGAADPLDWMNGADAKPPDDDWAGFASTDKKGKKNKKGKVEPAFGSQKNDFSDINLGDTPKIDISFGTDFGTTKGQGSDFGFGGWGSSWDTANAGGVGAGATGIMNNALGDTGDTGGWGSGSTKKNKKTTTTAGFDFGNLDTLDEDQTTAAAGQEDWATGFGKKNKKSTKKSALDDASEANDMGAIGTAVADPPAADDSWATWGTSASKKDKGKKKKGDIEEVPPVPPVEPPADDTYAFGTKGKKKGKKGAVEEPVVPLPEVKPAGDTEWGGFDTKKDKKKGRNAFDEPKFDEEPTINVDDFKVDDEPEPDAGWGFSSKKGKKKKEPEPAIVAVPDPEPETSLGWGSFGAKKGKKKGAEAIEEVEEKEDDIVAVVTDPDPIVEAGWGSFGSKKTTKKGKGGTVAEVVEDTHIVQVPDPDPPAEDTFDAGWGATATTKKGKKDKKGGTTAVKDDPISVIGSSAAKEATKVADDDWSNWGSDKKTSSKSGKKGAADEGLPPPPPPVPAIPDFPETSSIDPWAASTTSKKDKKGKKGRTVDPEPAIIEVPDFSKAEDEEDEWGSLALTPTEKKKREKAKLKEREKEEKEKKEQEELEKKEKEEREKKEKEEKEKEKAKPGKKGKLGTTTAASKTKDLMADSVPDTMPAVEEDTWGASSMWGSSKKDSKKKPGKKDDPYEVPPTAPTPPAQGLTPPPESNLDDLAEDDWGNYAPAKDKDKGKKDSKKLSKTDDSKAGKSTSKEKAEEKKKETVEETPAKAARSFWGGMTTPATSKSKTSKEKEAEKAAQELDFDGELDLDEIVEIVEEDPPPKKGSKSKAADSKLLKSTTTSKDDKASKKAKADAEMDALIDFDDLDAKDSNSKTADASSKSKGDDKDKKADAFSFWGSSKKTSGKNGDEPKKEINKQKTANQSDPLAFLSNEPEPSPFADEPAPSQPSKPSKSAMSTSKTSAKLSVAQKVKALEEERKKALEPTPVAVLEPEPEPPAKKSTKSKTAATTAATAIKSTSAAKKKESSPPPSEPKKKSRDSVPGSFPAEGFEEENLIDMLATSPVEKKSAKKSSSAKTAKPPKKEPHHRDMIDMDVDEMPAVPAAPPTPPADPKPAKKERARVVRDEGASSWGFWGAAPKKDAKKATKAKDDADVPSTRKTATPALVRSKSTKAPKEKDKDTEKSSGSDGKEKKAESRPSKSRASSFGAFFGGPPPVRTKPVRRTSVSAASKTTSNRQSMDVDGFGLPSPPPEDSPAMTGKAAKLMGTTPGKLNRRESTKGKQKASAAPDPYPIDDDDMVMVNGIEDPVINAPIPKGKSTKDKNSRNKSKREVKPDFDADVVMVDGSSPEEPEILAFDEKPRAPAPLQRSMTSSKKPGNGKLMGLFGGFGKTRRNSDTLERPKGKAIVTDDEAMPPRKRTVNGREDSSKRIRRDDRKVRRSEKPDREADGFITDALNDRDPATAADDADVRRPERRGKRDAKDSEARRRDPADKIKVSERRSKRVDDEDLQRHEEKHSRRSGRDDIPVEESGERTKHSSSRPHKSDRRRSCMDPPQTSDRPKAHRSRTEQASGKRRSVAVDGYFDPRNAVPEAGKNEPYMHGANDHTSSWVKSQLSDPADPPPVEGTVIEPTPKLGGKGGYAEEEERKAARKARRQSRYGAEDEPGDGERDRRRRRKDKEGEGSVELGGREREKLSRRHTDMSGVRGAVDARPSLGAAGKRSSWLKKVTGMGA